MHSSPQASSSPSLSPRLSSIQIDGESLATDTANPKANPPSGNDSSNITITAAPPTLPLQPAPEKSEKHEDADADPLVMQIVVRRDLLDAENWGVGPLMAQVAHAATAVLHETRTRPETIAYLSDLKNMRKVVLQAPDLPSLLKLSSLLSAPSPIPASSSSSNPPSSSTQGTIDQPTKAIPHHLWIEQPENVPTCLALAPNHREKSVRRALDKARCRLWR